MECRDVRELLAEQALGTLDRDTSRWVDRHLAWCAGCRKEAEDLAAGVAALPLAVGGPAPPRSLEDRVVRAVSREARRPARGRRVAIVAAALASILAAGSIAWALSVRGRIGVLERAAEDARADAEDAAAAFAITADFFAGRDLFAATLVPAGRLDGGGRAIVYESPQGRDFAVIVLGGLPAKGRYDAELLMPSGPIELGALERTGPGRLSLLRYYDDEVDEGTEVVVRDARGRDVLRGRLSPYTD